MERNDNGILRSPLRNDSYYGSNLFLNGSGAGNTSDPIPKGRKVQNVKIIDAIFFDPDIEPDPGYWAMKKVKAIHDRATQVFINSDGHVVYKRTEDEELEFYLENEHLFVRSPGGEDPDVPTDLASFVTPQMFGATGGGEVDDTTALNRTFNRSDSVIEGGNQRYKLGEVVITEQNNLVIQDFRFYHGISITLKHCQNVIFRNCVWEEFQDGGVANKTVQCVILTTMHTGSSEWVEANNWRMDEVCKNIRFEGCRFEGTHFTENTPSLYDGTKPHYNTGMCLRLEGVDGLYVDNCYFTQNRGNACVQQNCYAPLGDFSFTNNFFYLNCWGGIELYRYTGMSSHPTRIIQGNRFIGHGLGYLPWSYLERFDEDERGVGTAALLGGHTSRIANEPAFCTVVDNYFEDNNESSVEGWQWNPVKNNVIIGNGVLQTSDSVTEMTQKYKITYQLYVRKNPSQNPIYINQSDDIQYYSSGEVRSIENNTIGRFYGTRNPILIRGYFYEQLVFRNNTLTDEVQYSGGESKYVHFLNAVFHRGIIWENNVGMKPYFNACTFADGKYLLDEMEDIYQCTFISHDFESISKRDRFSQLKSALFNPEWASMRDNTVSSVVNGKPELSALKIPAPVVVPDPTWDIKDDPDYVEGTGYTFGGQSDPTILDTQQALGATDTDWTIYVNTTTTDGNGWGNHNPLIHLLTFTHTDGTVSLDFGSRFNNDAYTYIFPNGYWGYDTAYCVDSQTGGAAKNFLASGKTSQFVLRHKASSGKIDIFAIRSDVVPSVITDALRGTFPFTSGTSGTLRFGGSNASTETHPEAYYHGVISDARVFNEALGNDVISVLMLGVDTTDHSMPTPIYDITDEPLYDDDDGLVMDGTFAIDTGVALLEDTNDFTIIARFKYDDMGAGEGKPNFTFIPAFSAFSAAMADDTHTGHTDKGIDIGLSMQDGLDPATMAKGGFIYFRRDWRYVNSIELDMNHYRDFKDVEYSFIIVRKNNVISVYDKYLQYLGGLSGEYATAIVNGNLTIGARMGYSSVSGYSDFFEGTFYDFQVYDKALDLLQLEQLYPSIYDNDMSKKGAVTYYLSNKNYVVDKVRLAFVELMYDLGEYADDEYTEDYPKAFGVRFDESDTDLVWVPCSAADTVGIYIKTKWSAEYGPYEAWTMEIINPGTVPDLTVKIKGVKVLLLSAQGPVEEESDEEESEEPEEEVGL